MDLARDCLLLLFTSTQLSATLRNVDYVDSIQYHGKSMQIA